MTLWLALLGCGTPAVCNALHERVPVCDLVPQADTCGDLPLSEQIQLLRDLKDDGCDSLVDAETRQIRPEACEAFGWDCPPALLSDGPAHLPSGVYPEGALVFVGGIDDADLFGWHEELVDTVGRETEVHHVVLPGWGSTEARTDVLWEEVQQLTDDGESPVNLVCYAVGGLDCRNLVSPGGLFHDDPVAQQDAASRVASITTVQTPHHGTNVADALLALPAGEWREVVGSGVLGGSAALGRDAREEQLEEVLGALTIDQMRTFNQHVVDAESVVYRSWAGVSFAFGQRVWPAEDDIATACQQPDGTRSYRHWPDTQDPMSDTLWTLAPFAEVAPTATGRDSAPSDGMIAVDSAVWGTFSGCVPADHYDAIGRFGPLAIDPVTGFDPVSFVRALAADLVEEGL